MNKGAWIVGLIAICGTAAVRASEGRIPVFDTTVINQPGHYVVTRGISTAGPSPVITMGGAGCTPFSGVTLDLNGHTLAKSVAVDVIRIETACVRGGVTIRNGRIVGPDSGGTTGAGIFSSNSAQIQIRIEDVEIGTVGGSGVDIRAARDVEVRNCHIHDVGGFGISVAGFFGPFRGSIAGNTIDSTRFGGLTLSGLNAGQVRSNVITNFGLDTARNDSGIRLLSAPAIGDIVGGNLVEGNTVSSLPGGTNDDGLVIDGLPGLTSSNNL